MLLAATQVWGFEFPRRAFLESAIIAYVGSFGIATIIGLFELARVFLKQASSLRRLDDAEMMAINLTMFWISVATLLALLPLRHCVDAGTVCAS